MATDLWEGIVLVTMLLLIILDYVEHFYTFLCRIRDTSAVLMQNLLHYLCKKKRDKQEKRG